jgi:hypothetical protein
LTTDGANSGTKSIREPKRGDQAAATRLLGERSFNRLARLAEARLGTTARGPVDGEDVAVSVFEDFFRGTAAGRFPHLEDHGIEQPNAPPGVFFESMVPVPAARDP